MKNNNGFSFIEVLVASAIILMLAVLVFPISSQLKKDSTILNEKRRFALKLHDELQPFIQGRASSLPSTYSKTTEQKETFFEFTEEHIYVKGCVSWNNAKKQKEQFCLYGLPEK